VYRECHHHKTHFTSLFIITLSHHQSAHMTAYLMSTKLHWDCPKSNFVFSSSAAHETTINMPLTLLIRRHVLTSRACVGSCSWSKQATVDKCMHVHSLTFHRDRGAHWHHSVPPLAAALRPGCRGRQRWKGEVRMEASVRCYCWARCAVIGLVMGYN
jgi:hypothetical protein